MNIYLIGSLRNPQVPNIANLLRVYGHEVFDDWYGAGREADDEWQRYEKTRGRSYAEALDGYAARHVFGFDRTHLLRADAAVLVMPAGKSGCLELGFAVGAGKKGYVLFEQEPERWDLMFRFADSVFFDVYDLIKELAK